jgi:hypothetical protein
LEGSRNGVIEVLPQHSLGGTGENFRIGGVMTKNQTEFFGEYKSRTFRTSCVVKLIAINIKILYSFPSVGDWEYFKCSV